MSNPINIPNSKERNFSIDTVKGIFWYDNFSYAAHSDEGKRANLLEKLKGKKITYYKVYW